MKLPTPPQITLGLLSISALVFAGMNSARADNVINDDLIVDGSACIGFDCVNGESFGFDTLRLKENNLRINFDDTSTSASFPDNDWRIIANDSANGGGEYLGIEDSSGGRIPFRVEAGARVNALYVESDGDIGIGTNNPAVDLEIVTGNTPTVRLRQDGSSGFSPQTWDLAGNETNFFIRDATSGSTLPFRIYPAAPTSALTIEGSTGDIGVGTTSPDAALEVERSNGTAQVLVTETNGTAQQRDMFVMSNNGQVNLRQTDTSTGNAWSQRSGGTYRIFLGGTVLMTLDTVGNVTFAGTVTPGSDENTKENFAEISKEEILDKVVNLPVTTWNYINDKEDVRHIGPMAQDFQSAFKVGKDDKGISVTDSAGVALVSIQALNEKVEEKDAEIRKLEERLAKLEKMLEKAVK